MSNPIVTDARQAVPVSTPTREAVSAPSLDTVSARELLELFEHSSDVGSLEALRTHWVDSVGTERAAVELTKVMRSGPSRDRATAFFWLAGIPTVAEAAIRVALEDPNVRPYGVVWLRESGLPGPDPTAEEVRWLYVDLLAVALGDEERLADAALRAVVADGSVEEQILEIRELWRCDHPATAGVLEMLGRHHSHPDVAEAARVAAAKARSSLE